MLGVFMPRLVVCFLMVINTWTKRSRRERGPGHTHSVCVCFMTPFQLGFERDCRSLPAGCVHAGNAAMLSVFHFVELCSKREAGCVHPSLATETAVFHPEVPSVSGQPHYRRTKSHLFGRKKE